MCTLPRISGGFLGNDYEEQPFYGLSKLAVRFHKFLLRFLKPTPLPNSRDRKRNRDCG